MTSGSSSSHSECWVNGCHTAARSRATRSRHACQSQSAGERSHRQNQVVSTLSELVGAHTDLTPADIDRLHSLVADWAMLADLSFADLLLCVRVEGLGVRGVPRRRPGAARDRADRLRRGHGRHRRCAAGRCRPRCARAASCARATRSGSAGCRCGSRRCRCAATGSVIAVLARDTNLSATRSPSALELAYLRTAGDLVQMVAEGTFPFDAGFADSAEAPRVGDGMIRLDGDGIIAYASPNAVSAYRRLGHNGNLVGESLAEVHRQLLGPPGRRLPPLAAAELPAGPALSRRRCGAGRPSTTRSSRPARSCCCGRSR